MEPQADLPPLPQAELSKLVVTRAKRTVPYPLLGENTLVSPLHPVHLAASMLRMLLCMLLVSQSYKLHPLSNQHDASTTPSHTASWSQAPGARSDFLP